MKILARLTDKVLFNKEGISFKKPVRKSLVLLKNRADLYACLYNSDNDSYRLLESDKYYFLKLKKIIKEETDCTVTQLNKLGKVIINSLCLDYVQHTDLYLCETDNSFKTKKEKNKEILLWLNLDELMDRIVFKEYSDTRKIYLQELDKELIRVYFKMLKIIR